MDTNQLRYLVEIAECGNITKAAENCYISQSGLNQQLNRIEKELGVTLFERDTHHLQITEAGEIVVNYARDALSREKQMRMMVSDAKDGNVGELHVNIAMEQGIELFSRIFPVFHQKFPRVSVKVEDFIVSEEYQLLRKGKLDIGMVMEKNPSEPGIEYVPLAEERFLLGIPKVHPLARFYQPDGDYPEMDLSWCRDEPFSLMFSGSTFRKVIDPYFRIAGFEPNVMFESRSNHIIALMAEKGFCLTILPESQAKLYRDQICWFRILGNPTWSSCLAYSRDNPPGKAGRYYMDLAVKNSGFLWEKTTP